MKKRSFSPQKYLASVFELDDFECFCIERLREKAESGREPALSKSELAAGFFKEGKGAEKEEDAAQLMAAFWPDSPLMRYFLREERGTGIRPSTEFKAWFGLGVTAKVSGREYAVSRYALGNLLKPLENFFRAAAD